MTSGDIKIINDMSASLLVMREAGKWLKDSGKNPNKWWQLQNLTPEFLLQFVTAEEFYVVTINGAPAASAVLQITDSNQWEFIDGNTPSKALYIHWVCVSRQFAGRGLPTLLIKHAEKLAQAAHVAFMRVDTNADEPKLRRIYESNGFTLVKVLNEGYRNTAYFQKALAKQEK